MTYQRPKHRHRHYGFTLVELLVVMGIMVVLMGLVLAVVFHALKAGKKSRVQADFQTISVALEAYHDDCHDYPRFPNNGSNVSGQWDMTNQRGAELLCRALVGPGPGLMPTGGDMNSGVDGAGDPNNAQLPTPGFRIRTGVDSTGAVVAQGKVYGPYLAPDKFRIVELLPPLGGGVVEYGTAVLLDSDGHTILYFPAASALPNFASSNAYVAFYADPNSPPPATTQYLYNAFDNCMATAATTGGTPPDPLNNPLIKNGLSTADFFKLLGLDTNGQLTSMGATPAYTGPYILWTAGADGNLGLSTKDGKSDNIANFDIPPNLRK